MILVTWFYLWASSLLREHAVGSIVSHLDRLQNQVDAVNEVSLDVMYSNLVKNRFQTYLHTSQSEVEDEDTMALFNRTKVESAADLADILTAIIGPSQPVPQLYLYDFQGLAYGIGYHSHACDRHHFQIDFASRQGIAQRNVTHAQT